MLSQDGQFACLLILQGLEHRLVLGLGRNFHLMVAQGFVLLGLHLTCVLELLLNLQLQSLVVGTETGRKTVCRPKRTRSPAGGHRFNIA